MEILPVKLQTVFTQFKEMSIWSFCLAKRRDEHSECEDDFNEDNEGGDTLEDVKCKDGVKTKK